MLWLRGRIFWRYERDNSQRHLEELRAERERNRLTVATAGLSVREGRRAGIRENKVREGWGVDVVRIVGLWGEWGVGGKEGCQQGGIWDGEQGRMIRILA